MHAMKSLGKTSPFLYANFQTLLLLLRDIQKDKNIPQAGFPDGHPL
jgi:hypothetical protein